jgi:GxxExxY protein
MIVELYQRGFSLESEVPCPVLYRGIKVNEEGFRLDLLVENNVIVELKSVEKVLPVHQKQLLTYLRLSKKPLGLLINFNAAKLVDGITRIVNWYLLQTVPKKYGQTEKRVSHRVHRGFREKKPKG